MKKRKLNKNGKILLGVLSVLLFILFAYIIDKIRFEINENAVNKEFVLQINDETIYPSRVISKSNYIFDHYDDELIEISVPRDSVLNIPEEYQLLDENNQEVFIESNYLKDGKYFLSFEVGDYTYKYNLVVDNMFYATLDTTYAKQSGFVIATLFDINEGEEFVVETSFISSDNFKVINNQVIIPIGFRSPVGDANITFRNEKGVTTSTFNLQATRTEVSDLYIPDYQVKTLTKEEEQVFNEAINTISDEKLFTRFVDPTIGYTSGEFGDIYHINGSEEPLIYHTGYDYVNEEGTTVNATANGKVLAVGFNEVNGNYIVIDHGYGVTSVYNNLHTQDVAVGDVVSVGGKIGTMGKSGNVTGVHLHFEIKVNGVSVDPGIFLYETINF